MDYSLYDFLTLLGSLGFFIYGMKIMSDGIQQAAGERLRHILAAMTRNRYFGVLTGLMITAIVQSSSATTVMTVSFVNAGLLTLLESAGVMMGANVGTTITAWLISSLGFEVKISTLALPLIAFGLPMYFSGKDKIRNWGQFIIGFALLFMGLDELKSSVPDVKNNPEILEFLSSYTNLGIFSTLIFVIVGTLLTIVVQSSSASMALTLVMTYNGWIPFEIAAAMVLGENIGTTITAELAALVANVHAKRAARIHSTFNIIGVTWMIIIMPYFLDLVAALSTKYFGNSPYENPEAIPYALSLFHTMFNTTNVLLFIAFVPLLVKIATRTVPSKGEDDEEFHLSYIGKTEMLRSSEFAMEEVKQEMVNYAKLVVKMKKVLVRLYEEPNPKKRSKLLSKLENLESMSDHFEEEIDKFLVKVTEGPLSPDSSRLVKTFLQITSDLELMGDLIMRMATYLKRGNKMDEPFSTEQTEGLNKMFSALDGAFDTMMENLKSNYSDVDYETAHSIETSIDKLKKELWRNHLVSIEEKNGGYNVKGGIVYKDIFSTAEVLGNYVFRVSESIAVYAGKVERNLD